MIKFKTHKKQLLKLLIVTLVFVSALMVIISTHLSRDRFNQFEKLKRVETQLMVRWHRLLLEESAWSSLVRVERLATQRLKMRVPQPSDIRVVSQ